MVNTGEMFNGRMVSYRDLIEQGEREAVLYKQYDAWCVAMLDSAGIGLDWQRFHTAKEAREACRVAFGVEPTRRVFYDW